MIISERQIMQLIQVLNQYMEIFLLINTPETRDMHDRAGIILCEIANQQSEELKAIE